MNEKAIAAATEVMHERGHWRVDDEDMKAALAAAFLSLRAREEIARAFERLFPQYKRDGFTGGDRQDYETLKAALSSTAGQDDEADKAYGYISRLFKEVAPQCKPLPTLMGIFTQIDNYIAGLRGTAGQEWRDISSAPKGGSLAEKLRRRADEHEAKGDRKSKTIADELRAWAAEDVAK